MPIREEDQEFTFDLSDDPLMRNGRFDDLLLSYWTPSSCDHDVWIYNFVKKKWEQIIFVPDHQICFQLFSEQVHLLSARGIDARSVVSHNNQVRIRGKMLSPELRAVDMNDDFYAIPILPVETQYLSGIAFDGTWLWGASGYPRGIYRISLTGMMLRWFTAPSQYPRGMAYDGRYLWLVSRTFDIVGKPYHIIKMSLEGEYLGYFSVPLEEPWGLTWGEDKLWLTENSWSNSRIFGIEPDVSIISRKAVVTDTLQAPGDGYGYSGLAWNGSQLLAVREDTLFILTTSGDIQRKYSLPVGRISDMAWDGEAVWMLSSGLRDLENQDQMLVRFKLR